MQSVDADDSRFSDNHSSLRYTRRRVASTSSEHDKPVPVVRWNTVVAWVLFVLGNSEMLWGFAPVAHCDVLGNLHATMTSAVTAVDKLFTHVAPSPSGVIW